MLSVPLEESAVVVLRQGKWFIDNKTKVDVEIFT